MKTLIAILIAAAALSVAESHAQLGPVSPTEVQDLREAAILI